MKKLLLSILILAAVGAQAATVYFPLTNWNVLTATNQVKVFQIDPKVTIYGNVAQIGLAKWLTPTNGICTNSMLPGVYASTIYGTPFSNICFRVTSATNAQNAWAVGNLVSGGNFYNEYPPMSLTSSGGTIAITTTANSNEFNIESIGGGGGGGVFWAAGGGLKASTNSTVVTGYLDTNAVSAIATISGLVSLTDARALTFGNGANAIAGAFTGNLNGTATTASGLSVGTYNYGSGGTIVNANTANSATAATLATNTVNATNWFGLLKTNNVSGTPSNGQIPKVQADGSVAWSADSTGGSPSFDTVTSGTSLGQTLVVGNGSALSTSGSGTIAATTANNLASSATLTPAQVTNALPAILTNAITTPGKISSSGNTNTSITSAMTLRDSAGGEQALTIGSGLSLNVGTKTLTATGAATNAIGNSGGSGTNTTFFGTTTWGTNEASGMLYIYGDGTPRGTNSTLGVGWVITNGVPTFWNGLSLSTFSNGLFTGWLEVDANQTNKAGVFWTNTATGAYGYFTNGAFVLGPTNAGATVKLDGVAGTAFVLNQLTISNYTARLLNAGKVLEFLTPGGGSFRIGDDDGGGQPFFKFNEPLTNSQAISASTFFGPVVGNASTATLAGFVSGVLSNGINTPLGVTGQTVRAIGTLYAGGAQITNGQNWGNAFTSQSPTGGDQFGLYSGQYSLATNSANLALGGAIAGGSGSISVGYDSEVYAELANTTAGGNQSGVHAIGIGALGRMNGDSAVGVGYGYKIFAQYGTGIGEDPEVYAIGGTALGGSTIVGTNHVNSVALGFNSHTSTSNQVMLGASSPVPEVFTYGTYKGLALQIGATKTNVVSDSGSAVSGVGITNLVIYASYNDALSLPATAFYTNNQSSPASAMAVTNASGGFAFADAATNTIRASFFMPLAWNSGTVQATIQALCTGTNSTFTTNVVWSVRAAAIGDGDDVSNPTFGTAIWVTNHVSTAAWIARSATTLPITVGNSPSTAKAILFEISRLGGQVADTLTNSSLVLKDVSIAYTKVLNASLPTATP